MSFDLFATKFALFIKQKLICYTRGQFVCGLLQATALPNLEFEVRTTIGAAAIEHGSKEVIALHHFVKKKSHVI